MKNKKLNQLIEEAILPIEITLAIEEVLKEEQAYVADELVELSELILLELAALGIAAYLRQPNQKSVYNDFLLQLFTTRSHDYNAGALYRWSANMIKDLDTSEALILYPLFWEKAKGEEKLNSMVHHLALLRNEVMHGFFILPPDRNNKEANHITQVIEEIHKAEIFKLFDNEDFHFFTKQDGLTSYRGRWGIQENEWSLLKNTFAFGQLASKTKYQLSDEFEEDQQKWISEHANSEDIDNELIEFISNHQQGAFAFWHRPNQDKSSQIANLCSYLLESDSHLPQLILTDTEGITFTSKFLLNRLVQTLAKETESNKYSSDPKKAIKQLRKNCEKQVVVIIKDVHQSLFQLDHLLHLSDFFYENKIILIAFGYHYPWMNQFFNNSKGLNDKTYCPEKSEWLPLLHNYLRFKGPNHQVQSELFGYETLVKIITHLLKDLAANKKIVARRFADEHLYSMEYVHEAFDFLYPFLKSGTLAFEEDVLDDLFGFPKDLTESSRLYFSIGRRDAKLEYQHQTISL